MTNKPEKHAFQAEVKQILSLVVNSLYTHKEIFLRELVSNASDALDQLSFRSLTEPQVMGDDKQLRIELVADREANTFTIRDNGVGMDHDALVTNLGTIAHSGTAKLIESLSGDDRKDLSLIGQFGVGFYSAFLVADRVRVVTRAAGADQAWAWESDAEGEFTVEEAERDGRGTDVILYLKDDEHDFLREWTIRELVRKYSDFVRHPIRLEVERQEKEGEGDDAVSTKVKTWEQVNEANALWTRSKADVTEEQYTEFYKHLTHDWNPPLAHTHFHVEGGAEMRGLLFLPKSMPMDFLGGGKKQGLRLFVKRVFIMEDCEEILPQWLRFVRGVVDSEDLPLNVSREFLQKDRISATIKKQVVRRTLSLLEELADEGEVTETDDDGNETTTNRYEDFWREFGRILKEGVHHEPKHKERIAKLLRFESSKADGLTSLDGYLERMAEGQEAIYFLAAENRAAAEGSPHIEALKKRDLEVLFLLDPVDEWVVEALKEYEEKKLVSAAKGDLDLGDSDEDDEEEKERKEKEKEKRAEEFSGLLEAMKEPLDEKVKEVRLSDRLTDSPACLVADPSGLSPHLERLLRANNQPVPEQKRTLELNADHPVVVKLREMAADDARADQVRDWTWLLYDQALVAEGSPPSDPARFARQVAGLMEKASD